MAHLRGVRERRKKGGHCQLCQRVYSMRDMDLCAHEPTARHGEEDTSSDDAARRAKSQRDQRFGALPARAPGSLGMTMMTDIWFSPLGTEYHPPAAIPTATMRTRKMLGRPPLPGQLRAEEGPVMLLEH